MATTERDRMLDDAVAVARQHDHTDGLRERVLHAAITRWPADIAATAAGRAKVGQAIGALLDADLDTLGALGAQLGIGR